MTDSSLENLIEINLFYAKAELCRMTDPSAPARALFHIEEALKELLAANLLAANATKQSGAAPAA